jgi:hypothetical protein
MSEILTPESPRWEEFCDALDAAVYTTGCKGDRGQSKGKPHQHARKIMVEMGDVDIDKSLAFFEAHGGFCDCEILLNVDPD